MVTWRKYRGGRLYTVVTDLWHMRLPDHLEHGYENRSDFFAALRELSDRWQGRVGEAVGERNGFLQLRFHDTPGGRPDEAWLPVFLLRDVTDDYPDVCAAGDQRNDELDECFGFD